MSAPTPVDPVALTADLIRCPSVTPEEGGALQHLQTLLEGAGFDCTRVDRGGVSNLFARWGKKGAARTFGFNGHTDVVPVGDAAAWTADPFGAEVREGRMYGRGATDMKSGVAAFAAAAVDFVRQTPPDGAVVLAITGDEEGDAIDGTTALLDWMQSEGETMSHCLVGEPTCPATMGEMIKIGRRGSMTAWFTATGKQGHSAYPHRAKNPLPAMARLIDRLASHELDQGTDHFDPSTLAVVQFDTGNGATNVIPAQCRAAVNIRFNDLHSGASLSQWLRREAQDVSRMFDIVIETEIKVSGEAFLTPPGELSDLVAKAVEAETGVTPELSTTGGTSDARFVKDLCPVVEFGLVGETMHQVDENVPVEQITQLKGIYARILADYFA
ncbi:succinyldiaminopimelate desuccinylase [Pseudooceanicola antarcticus]|uniref:Succinyl-diaminopimelate desuccinylase n=1 Tax=Pseudooceanicola antarcticus TaxID=1247613 RepID=A0A285HMG8_9RHOB|nr:succinyl-diaminopimelate desuccinylase [Pseudooceanicola antarcticus]PJE27803.1 succinyl-diaminopimelate desuccinylase [Pseudooceanicola antarcticus]SNY36915.1 succinyldiaminopimelate desuccinylase [Pseudooceanicola antarcticus]